MEFGLNEEFLVTAESYFKKIAFVEILFFILWNVIISQNDLFYWEQPYVYYLVFGLMFAFIEGEKHKKYFIQCNKIGYQTLNKMKCKTKETMMGKNMNVKKKNSFV